MGSKIFRKDIRDFLGMDSNPTMKGSIASIDKREGIEDPTYLTFFIRFNTDSTSDSLSQQGLFSNSSFSNLLLPPEDKDSAINYLYRVNKNNQAVMLSEFRETLKQIQNDKPWYFQKIDGLAELMPNSPELHWKEKDKFVTIELLDGWDQRTDFLLNLYNTAVFDNEMRRVLLPQNMRYFNVDIYVTEFRSFIDWVPDSEIPQVESHSETPSKLTTGDSALEISNQQQAISDELHKNENGKVPVGPPAPPKKVEKTEEELRSEWESTEEAKKIRATQNYLSSNPLFKINSLLERGFQDWKAKRKQEENSTGISQANTKPAESPHTSLEKKMNEPTPLRKVGSWKIVDSQATFKIFHLERCEFVLDSGTFDSYSSISVSPEEMLKHKLKFKVGICNVETDYGFFGWKVDQFIDDSQAPKTAVPKSFGDLTIAPYEPHTHESYALFGRDESLIASNFPSGETTFPSGTIDDLTIPQAKEKTTLSRTELPTPRNKERKKLDRLGKPYTPKSPPLTNKKLPVVAEKEKKDFNYKTLPVEDSWKDERLDFDDFGMADSTKEKKKENLNETI